LNPRFFRNGIVMLLLVVVALAVVLTVVNTTTPTSNVQYSDFLTNVAKKQVSKVLQEGSSLTVTAGDGQTYTVVVPGLLADQVLPDMQRAVARGSRSRPSAPSSRPTTAGSRS